MPKYQGMMNSGKQSQPQGKYPTTQIVIKCKSLEIIWGGGGGGMLKLILNGKFNVQNYFLN